VYIHILLILDYMKTFEICTYYHTILFDIDKRRDLPNINLNLTKLYVMQATQQLRKSLIKLTIIFSNKKVLLTPVLILQNFEKEIFK